MGFLGPSGAHASDGAGSQHLMDLVMSHYVRMYVWGDGEQEWEDILGASESISSEVKGRIGVGS